VKKLREQKKQKNAAGNASAGESAARRAGNINGRGEELREKDK